MNTENTENTKNTENTENTVSKKNPKFRIKGTKFALTYTYKTLEFVCTELFFKGILAYKKIIIAHETGEKTGMEHTHVGVWFTKEFNTTNERIFDIDGCHPNIQVCKKWDAWVTYCTKDGNYKANFEIFKIAPLIDKIVESKSCIDAVKTCAKSLKDVVPIIQIYNNKGYVMDEDLKNELLNMEFRPWQNELYNKLTNESDRRKIFWIHEKIGNTGKTTFCDIMEVKNMHECIVIAATGSLRDIADIIRNWMDAGNTPKYVLIDLPRTFEDRDSIYTILESVKNGRLSCTKYKGTTLRFRSPSVCVFSNWAPVTSKCSADRWNIFTISRDGSLLPVTLREEADSISDE